jgi:hypothetical protein
LLLAAEIASIVGSSIAGVSDDAAAFGLDQSTLTHLALIYIPAAVGILRGAQAMVDKVAVAVRDRPVVIPQSNGTQVILPSGDTSQGTVPAVQPPTTSDAETGLPYDAPGPEDLGDAGESAGLPAD